MDTEFISWIQVLRQSFRKCTTYNLGGVTIYEKSFKTYIGVDSNLANALGLWS